MKKHMISIAAAIALALICLAPAPANADYDRFDDVDANAEYADAVNWAARCAVTNGVSATEFLPDAPCTRAQAVTFLWRFHGCPAPKQAKTAFSDVPKGSYYETAVAWAAEQGLIGGASEFHPESQCACAEVLDLIWRGEGCPDPEEPDGAAEGFNPSAVCSRSTAIGYFHDASFRFVTTVDGLVNELKPCRSISLAPGVYNLTEWMANASEAERNANPHVRVEETFDGLELKIVGLDHATFCTPTNDPTDTRIVVEPRYANVLNLVDCSDVTLRGMTMGHTPEQGYCMGGVVNLENCGRVVLQDLDLYGCGTYGVTALKTESIRAGHVVIHDCSYGGMELNKVSFADFADCVVRDCREFTILGLVDSNARFTRCTFENNEWNEYFDFLFVDGSAVRFDQCTFDRASYFSVTNNGAYGKSVSVSGEIVK